MFNGYIFCIEDIYNIESVLNIHNSFVTNILIPFFQTLTNVIRTHVLITERVQMVAESFLVAV